MRLVLDSNVFCQDYRLASTSFRLLRGGLQIIPADLRVPQVVVDEVVNRFKEDLEEEVTKAKHSEARVGRLLARPDQSWLDSVNVATEVDAYRQWFVSVLVEFGGGILPYPEVPHEEVVKRDLQRKKPFKRNGAGYRDFLIWESIRGLMLEGTERVVFVTGNTVDFGDGPLVAPDLQETITNPDRLELVPGLEAFNEKFILPRLEIVDDLKARLKSDTGMTFDLARWLRANLLDLLRDEDWGPIAAGFPDGVGSLRPTEVVAFGVMDVDDARQLSEHEVLVRLRVTADIEFRVEVGWDDYMRYPQVREWAGEGSEPFSWSSWRHVESLTLVFNRVFDPRGDKMIAEEIALIEGPYASVQME